MGRSFKSLGDSEIRILGSEMMIVLELMEVNNHGMNTSTPEGFQQDPGYRKWRKGLAQDFARG